MAEKYKVFMGATVDEEVSVGFLEKGNATIKGKEVKARFRKGNYVFPAITKAWGRRLQIPKGKNADNKPAWPGKRIDINEPASNEFQGYLGHIEWLPYGHKDGYMIEARYSRSTSTLDYRYQVAKEGLPTVEQDLENNYLEFPSGLNEFDYINDPVLIEFLKIYHGNDDSGSKLPNSDLSVFREVKTFDSKEQQVKEIDEAFEAVKMVKEANSFEKLKVIKSVLGRVTEIVYDQSKENNLYDSLILFAKNRSKDFLSCVQQYKVAISKLIEYTKAYKAFDFDTKGTIVVLQPTKEVLLTNAEGKGEEMADWMFANCMEPEVFEALEKLTLFSQKFK